MRLDRRPQKSLRCCQDLVIKELMTQLTKTLEKMKMKARSCCDILINLWSNLIILKIICNLWNIKIWNIELFIYIWENQFWNGAQKMLKIWLKLQIEWNNFPRVVISQATWFFLEMLTQSPIIFVYKKLFFAYICSGSHQINQGWFFLISCI